MEKKMKIIIDLDEAYSKEAIITYMNAINIDDELVKSIKFEKNGRK